MGAGNSMACARALVPQLTASLRARQGVQDIFEHVIRTIEHSKGQPLKAAAPAKGAGGCRVM